MPYDQGAFNLYSSRGVCRVSSAREKLQIRTFSKWRLMRGSPKNPRLVRDGE